MDRRRRGRDLHAIPLAYGRSWLLGERILVSSKHAVAPQVSLAIDARGRAYVAYVDGDAIWAAVAE